MHSEHKHAPAQSVRERLYIMVFQTDTVTGRRFDKILLLIILAS